MKDELDIDKLVGKVSTVYDFCQAVGTPLVLKRDTLKVHYLNTNAGVMTSETKSIYSALTS
jgi:hypothetical protein